MSEHPQGPRSGRRYLFDDRRNVRRLLWLLYAACGIALAADFVVHRHIDHPWEGLFGFYALYGFVACVVLVLAATQLRKVLMRREDHYE